MCFIKNKKTNQKKPSSIKEYTSTLFAPGDTISWQAQGCLVHSSFSLAGGFTGEKLTRSDPEGREALEEKCQRLTPRGSSSGRCYDPLG